MSGASVPEFWWQDGRTPGWYWRDGLCDEPMGPFASRSQAVADYIELRTPKPRAREFVPQTQAEALWAAANVVAARLDRLEKSDAPQGRLLDEVLDACKTLRTVVRGSSQTSNGG